MAFHSIVCIKSVIRSAPDGVGRRTPENSELNPFDRPALEAALRLKAVEGGTVTVLSMGAEVSAEALAEAQAMGADRAVLISDPALAGSDTLITAQVLAAAVSRIGVYDLLFFGTRSSDSDTGQVGPQTAAVLDIAFVGGVKQIEREDQDWAVRRVMDDWEELWQVTAPAALTIHPNAFKPRSIALPGIAAALDNLDIDYWDLDHLGLSADRVGLCGSPTRVVHLQKIKRDRTCHMLKGEPREQVDALFAQLDRLGAI